MIDWIQGEKFMGLANHIYAPPDGRVILKRHPGERKYFTPKHYHYLSNTLIHDKLKDNDIIYTHTCYMEELLDNISNVNKKLILITHNCDANVDVFPPDNVIRWFSQNVNIIHDKIESLPIGLENSRWYQDVHKREKMVDKLQQPRNYRNLVYMNHNISTYPQERRNVYALLENKPWVTSVHGTNPCNFDDYIDNIYNHKYIICPRGNGMDTHRLWETLYMGSIPIVKTDINNWFYNDMPILYVNAWEEVTEELLIDMLHMYSGELWNKNKLTFEYWKNRILKYAER